MLEDANSGRYLDKSMAWYRHLLQPSHKDNFTQLEAMYEHARVRGWCYDMLLSAACKQKQMRGTIQYHVDSGTMAKIRKGSSPLSAAAMYTCSNASHTSSVSPIDPMSHTVVTPVRQKKKNNNKKKLHS